MSKKKAAQRSAFLPKEATRWVGSSAKDLARLPEDIQHQFLRAITMAEQGGKADYAAPMASQELTGSRPTDGDTDCSVHVGTGNVFADVGLPNPEELQAKALISVRIEKLIKRQGLTQIDAASRMGITQPEVSLIVRGRLRGFTLDRLMQCVQALGQDVRIVLPTIARQDGSHGHMRVEYEEPVLPAAMP